MFWETDDEINEKKNKAIADLSGYQDELRDLNSQYLKILEIKEKLQQEITVIFEVAPNAEIYISEIDDMAWKGQKREEYEADISDIFNSSSGKLARHILEYSEEIDIKKMELETKADEINSTISSLNRKIKGYTAEIDRRK